MDGYANGHDVHHERIIIQPRTFLVLAGAVFALHQDMLRAKVIDMRKTDDGAVGALLDKEQTRRLGDFPERVDQTMKALAEIDDMNLNSLGKERSSHASKDDFQTHALIAKMRSMAARVWLLTIYSKIENVPMMGVGVTTIWLMLQQVEAEEILENAMEFSGTYFQDTRSDEMNLKQWGSGWA